MNDYVKCHVCSILLDLETEAIEYNRLYYCTDCYEEIIQEEQDVEDDNTEDN